jgi:hypothetical protein
LSTSIVVAEEMANGPAHREANVDNAPPNLLWLCANGTPRAKKARQIGPTGKSLRFAGNVSSPAAKNISLYRNSDLRY